MKKEIKDHPILFSTPMVKAILDGRKTQTRRIVKIDGKIPYTEVRPLSTHDCGSIYYFFGNKEVKCPYGQPGDVLWVREMFSKKADRIIYRADVCSKYDIPDGFKWKPSIHMPKNACRIFLLITKVRLERLQNITHDDAAREGVIQDGSARPVQLFKSLWQSINGYQSWNDNPWVWVIEFTRIKNK
jgi:hypothetical protein